MSQAQPEFYEAGYDVGYDGTLDTPATLEDIVQMFEAGSELQAAAFRHLANYVAGSAG